MRPDQDPRQRCFISAAESIGDGEFLGTGLGCDIAGLEPRSERSALGAETSQRTEGRVAVVRLAIYVAVELIGGLVSLLWEFIRMAHSLLGAEYVYEGFLGAK